LIQLIEEAAIEAIRNFIPPGEISLGTYINIKHLSPTPLGMKVTSHALLKKVDQGRLLFLVDAYDERGKIAEGEHERVLITQERFLREVDEKRRMR